MGPKTGGGHEHEPIAGTHKDLPTVMVWLGMQLGNEGKYADEIGSDFPPLKGWKIGILPVLSDRELMANTKPVFIPLIPGNGETKRQYKRWEKELGTPILFLLVPNYQPGFNDPDRSPWFAQPVKRDWLTQTRVQSLIDRYETRRNA